jgi:hypothetical protein
LAGIPERVAGDSHHDYRDEARKQGSEGEY